MKDRIMQLHQAMRTKLDALNQPKDIVQTLTKKISIVNETISELKPFIVDYVFTNREEEISFFKTLKPLLYSELLFYKKLLEIEINLPVSHENQKRYYQSELNRIGSFLERKRLWVTYYRTGATYLDDKYFLRNGSVSDPTYSAHIFTSDTRFCTPGSINFSRIRSCEMLVQELERRLAYLSEENTNLKHEMEKKVKRLKWKGPKVGLVELGYAFKEAGALDESLQEIFEGFEDFFSVKLENPPRTFQEILSRKKEENVYIDKLSAKLKERKDKMHENYKPKK